MARQLERLDAEQVGARLAAVQERIDAAARRAGRDPAEVEILAAVKYVPVELMGALADAGITLVGENTAQALIAKQERWGDRFTWDFIGHLQSRKTKDVLPRVRLIHSVDSDSVVEQIERHADERARVLLEVNAAGEESQERRAAGGRGRVRRTREPRRERGVRRPDDHAALRRATGGRAAPLRAPP